LSSAKWEKAKVIPYQWVLYADERYVAARFLYWKNFPFDFALLGAHALELYLKAYLINKTSKYPRTHDLRKLVELCTHHHDFFKSILQELKVSPTWITHLEMFRYPESSPDVDRPSGSAIIGAAVGGTIELLDKVASFVRGEVPRPEEYRDTIAELIRDYDLPFLYQG
jgi:HEPN domain-containing protein